MLDQSKPRDRLVGAAMRLAAERPWSEITLADIAAAAGLGLADVRGLVASKSEIVALFMRVVDDEVLRKSALRPAEPARDRLFDVVMLRFDTLMPWKPALKSIAAAGLTDVSLARPYLSSLHWMLQAAGIGTDGAGGSMRVAGLASVYASTFQTWLADEDPGMARTMAALDRRLRRGESAVNTVEETCSGAMRIVRDLPGVLSSVFKRRPAGAADDKPKTEPTPGSA
jgi:ubiquinone biosynthesis protein COQ9